MLHNRVWFQRFRDTAGDDGESGGGGERGGDDADKGKGDDEQQQELLTTLTRSVGMLANGLTKMQEQFTNLESRLPKAKDSGEDDDGDEKGHQLGDDSVDLEQLDRKGFAQYLMQNMTKAVQQEITRHLKSVDTKVETLAEQFQSRNASDEITKVSEKNADFFEWTDEIRQVLKENPTLSVTRAYNLAKTENPEKAEKVRQKYAKPAQERQSLTLTPTSSRAGNGAGARNMKPREAAEKAFDDVMSKLNLRSDALEGDQKLF